MHRPTSYAGSLLVVLTWAWQGAACASLSATRAPPATDVSAPPTAEPVVDAPALCRVLAEVEDAQARGSLAALRARYGRPLGEPPSSARSAAWLGALVSLPSPAERTRVLAAEERSSSSAGLGDVASCWLAADAISQDPLPTACDALAADPRRAALAELAKARAARRRGATEKALASAVRTAELDATCAVAHMERARSLAARGHAGDADAALAAWARAAQLYAPCFLCAVETAQLLERERGMAAAAPAWDAVRSLEPGRADVERRYAAALASTDPAAALAAYERALAAGERSVPTLLAAAQLAQALGDARRALKLADEVVQLQPVHLDGWRLVLSLALQTGDGARARAAALELLDLSAGDIAALLALGRAARAEGDLAEAVRHYDAAAKALSRGDAAAPPAEVDALTREHRALLAELQAAGRPARGSAGQVVEAVKASVERFFVQRLGRVPPGRKSAMRGVLEVALVVSAVGVVDDVEIIRDTLEDPVVVASVVAHLLRATITGGARRYAFQMEFQ